MQRRMRFKLKLHLKCGGSINIWRSFLGLWPNWPVPKGKRGDIRVCYKKMGRVLTWEVWSAALFCMLQFTSREQGLLKCRMSGNGKFPIGTSILP